MCVDEQRLGCRHCPHRRRCSTSSFYFQATKRTVLLSLGAFVRAASNESDERKCSSLTCSIGQTRKEKSIDRSSVDSLAWICTEEEEEEEKRENHPSFIHRYHLDDSPIVWFEYNQHVTAEYKSDW